MLLGYSCHWGENFLPEVWLKQDATFSIPQKHAPKHPHAMEHSGHRFLSLNQDEASSFLEYHQRANYFPASEVNLPRMRECARYIWCGLRRLLTLCILVVHQPFSSTSAAGPNSRLFVAASFKLVVLSISRR